MQAQFSAPWSWPAKSAFLRLAKYAYRACEQAVVQAHAPIVPGDGPEVALLGAALVSSV